MELDAVYPAEHRLYRWAQLRVKAGEFTCDTDQALLSGYQEALP
jgi:hypothetical protein